MKFLLRSASLLALFCISSLKPIHAQVLNGQSSFRAVTAQWRSDCDGDGFGVQIPFTNLTDRADEENVCHIWTEIDGQMLQPKYCHVWSAKNWEPSYQHRSERNFTNITIGAKENVSANHFLAKADYWENDIGDMCTFDQTQIGPITVDSDDRYTLNKTFHHIIPLSGSSTPFILGNVMVYDFRNRPQSQWFEYPEAAIELDNNPNAPPSERVYVKIKTIWNFTHGNDMDAPLNFGTIKPGNTYAEHVNSFYAHDVPEELAYKDAHFSDGLRDIAYVFALQDEADVTISIAHPETAYLLTYRVFNEQRQQVASSHDGGYSSSKTLAGLCAGRYYVVLDDISPNTFTSNPADRGFKLSVSAANFNPHIALSTNYWTVYTYDEVNLDHPSKYRGSYTVQPLEVDTDDFFPPGGDYSSISGFVANGCGLGTTSRDYFTQVFRRQFACGHYALRLNYLDDYVKVYVDGALVYENFSYGSGQGIVWQGEIKERMEVYHAELTGGERIHFEVLPGYGNDWRVHFYRKSSGLYFGDGRLVDKYGFRTVGLRDFLLSGAPTTIDDAYFNGHLVLRQACTPLGNTFEDFFIEFTQTGFTPGVYEVAVRNNLSGTVCSNCNFNFLVDGQSIHTTQNFTTYKVYLDGRNKASLFSDIGGVPWSFWQFNANLGPLMQNRGIRVLAQDAEAHLGIEQDKSSVMPCEAVTVSVQRLNGLGHIGSTVQWQRSADATAWSDIHGGTGLSYTDQSLNAQTHFRYVLKDRGGIVGYTSASVTVDVVPDPSFTGGQAMGAQIAEPCQAPAVLTVVGSSDMASFQWQFSTDGLNFSDINGARSADYLPTALTQATHFRRRGTNDCGLTTESSPVTVTLQSSIGYGTGDAWNIGVWGKPYSFFGPLNYSGSAVQAHLSIHLPNAMGGASNSPSNLPGYQGCFVDNSSYQVLFRRTGWPCGRYDFHLISLLGNLNSSIVARFDLDGDGTFDREESYSLAPFTTVERHYYVDLTPESRVELFYTKVAGSGQGGFQMNVSLDESATLSVNCQDITVYLDDAGEVALLPADVLASSSNTCGAPSLEVSPVAFTCQDIGLQTVTLTASSDNQASVQCTPKVMVADTTMPVARCQTATIYLNGQGLGNLASAEINNGSTDNCGISEISLSQTAFDCSHLGQQPVTLSVRDAAGNVSTCEHVVTVVDTEKPLLATTATSRDLGCNPTVQAPIFTGTDNCEGDFDPEVTTEGSVQDGCAYSQTWTASHTDACGNAAEPVSITYTWTMDTEKPLLATTATSRDLGCNPTVQAPIFTGTDNCQGDFDPEVITEGPVQDGCAYSQTWTASHTDACGNAAEPVSITYTWKEAAPIILSCPANETIAACQSQDVVDAAFDLWLAGATVSGGCNALLSKDAVSAPSAIGGSVTVTFTAASDCEADLACTHTFTVAPCFTLPGNIIWEHDLATPLTGATVTLSGDDSGSDNTDANGDYAIPTAGGSFLTLTPTKTGGFYEGVNVADVTRIQQHLNFSNRFNDGYKVIAADVNQSSSVTSLDAAVLFQAIAGNPNAQAIFQTSSWRFVEASHIFNDQNAPWLPVFPELINLVNVTADVTNQNFIGVKVGDVNGTWGAPAPLNRPALEFRADDQVLVAGQRIRVPFRTNALPDVAAWQFALRFDTDYLQFTKAIPSTSFPLDKENFGTWQADRGALRAVFAVPQGQGLEKGAVLFTLDFQVKQSGMRLSEVLRLAEDVLPGAVYDTQLRGGAVALSFTNSGSLPIIEIQEEAALGFVLEQNVPNPFGGETLIRFELPQAGETNFLVHDLQGRLLYEERSYLDAGQYFVRLDAARLGTTGVVTYTLRSGEHSATRRMVIVR